MRVGRDFKNGFVRVLMKENESIFGKAKINDSYSHLIYLVAHDLIKWGVIIKKKWHTIENSSRSSTVEFKIKDEWYNEGISVLPKDKIECKFFNRVCNHKIVKKKEQEIIDNKFNPLIALFKDVDIRKKEALEWIDRRVDEQDLNLGVKRKKAEGIICKFLDGGTASFWKEMVERFDEFYFTPDLKRGRVYSNATNLPKQLRQFLYFKSNPEQNLIELDIKNSQPLLLSLVASKWYEENNLIFDDDLISYKCECENGRFYNTMKTLMSKEGLKVQPTFKTDFFAQVLFNDDVTGRTYQMRRVFDKYFPSIGKCISSIKETYGYNEVSNRLTQVESKLIIERVGSKLIEMGIIFFPLHDAIFTIEETTDKVLNIIKEEFAKYGVMPKVKTKTLKADYV